MIEVGEMTPEQSIEFELISIKHDLEHVTCERDKSRGEVNACVEVIEALTRVLKITADQRDLLRRQRDELLSRITPKAVFIPISAIKHVYNHDPANWQPITEATDEKLSSIYE